MAYTDFFHIKKDKDGVELRFLKTCIDTVDCIINNKTTSRGDEPDHYYDDRHDEAPTIDKHFNIEDGDVVYVSKEYRRDKYLSDQKLLDNVPILIIIVYKPGKSAEVIYSCNYSHSFIFKKVVSEKFCLYKNREMIPLDESMFKADIPHIENAKLYMDLLYSRVYGEDISRYMCESALERAEKIYDKLFLEINDSCI